MVAILSSTEDLNFPADVFAALGNRIRLRILLMLIESKKPLHITAVARNLKMDYGGVHRHVEVLKDSGLLQVYEVGRSRVLSPLNGELVKDIVAKAQSFSKKR